MLSVPVQMKRTPGVDISNLPEVIFYRPRRDSRFFGWAHRSVGIEVVSFSIAQNKWILSEAVASQDPPRWVTFSLVIQTTRLKFFVIFTKE